MGNIRSAETQMLARTSQLTALMNFKEQERARQAYYLRSLYILGVKRSSTEVYYKNPDDFSRNKNKKIRFRKPRNTHLFTS